ncbi:hypothetical protein ACFFVB_06245 [Formosa undariae]|uniref:Glycosyl hydrolase family 30 TIM-barrel domain-containing protein n=1 Tax=Formosa undariae TaxID=1325436 RepID=A0ABV5EZT2_9FLAO
MSKPIKNLNFSLAKVRIFGMAMLLACGTMVSYAQQTAEVYALKLSGELSNGKISVQNIVQKADVISNKDTHKIKLYPEIEFQTLDGVGGAFNEIGGEALMSLPSALKDEVMTNIFSIQHGAGFTFCRTAVGASDFGMNAYSYSETPKDYNMNHFSIKREETSVIPYIQMAYDKNPKLKVFASPWSPPAWMKYSGYMDRGDEFSDKNHLIDDPKIYNAYALYFSKYIQAYAEKGITIDRLIIQNENDISTKYPSCVMPVSQMSNFTKNYLRPQFNSEGIKTEIWAGTFRTAGQIDAVELAANTNNRTLFDGIGIQYTYPKYIEQIHALYPEGQIMHTEGKCYDGKNTWEQASKRLKEVADYINGGSPNFCYWNMILNETTESGWGWKQNALINIDRKGEKITYNPDFAVMAFMSKYLKEGAKRIANFSREDLISVTFNGKIYVLIQNDKEAHQTYEYQVGNEEGHVVEIPGHSMAVIVI